MTPVVYCIIFYSTVHQLISYIFFFFLNNPPPPEFSPLPLHAALPIPPRRLIHSLHAWGLAACRCGSSASLLPYSRCSEPADRKSTRLNSSHLVISYAVFCLKKKKKKLSLC